MGFGFLIIVYFSFNGFFFDILIFFNCDVNLVGICRGDMWRCVDDWVFLVLLEVL